MNKIEELIHLEYSARMAEHIADLVLEGTLTLDDLMDCFFSADHQLSRKSAWALSKLADQRPDLVIPYTERMIMNLNRSVHEAIIRNTVRIWQGFRFPEELAGKVYEKSYGYLADSGMPPAIRIFAMTVCVNIAEDFPVLSEELIELISARQDQESAGFRSRAKKEVRRLMQIKISQE